MKSNSYSLFFRILSVILCTAIILVSTPQIVLAEAGELLSGTGATETPESVSEPSSEPAYVLGEASWERSYNAKTFRLSDGSFTLADYTHQVHFKDETDAWTDYDNTLLPVEGGYRNTASDVFFIFPESLSEDPVLVESDRYQIRFSLLSGSSSPIEIHNPEKKPEGKDIGTAAILPNYSSDVFYRDILPSADLQYTLFGSTLKENLILKERTGFSSVTFALSLENLIPSLSEDGSVLLQDPDSLETRFVIPAAYMEDSAGNRSDSVSYILESTDNGYLLTVTPDSDWLNAEDRVYPVTLDPTLVKYQTQYSGGRIKDTYVESGNSNPHGSWAWMDVGFSNGAERVSLIGIADSATPDYPALPAIPKTAAVTSAELRLRTLDASGTGVTVGVYQSLGNWDSSTVTSVPSYDPTVLEYVTVDAAGTGYVLDITKPVIEWYADGTDTLRSFGLVLKALSGSGCVSFSTVNNTNYNAQFPLFLISYRDTRGIEGNWQFFSYGSGNAGSGHINLFNGNLVFVHDEISSKGNLLPVTVSHVFNNSTADEDFTSGTSSITSDFSNMKVGKGWKLSAQETVNRVTLNGEYWYVYNDADGTELYFLPDTVNGLHLSEDGYPLYLQVTSGTYKYLLTDDSGNTKYFDTSGRLVKMTDAFGNARNFHYTNGRLTSISLTPNGGSQITQIQFEYNSFGALKKISTPLDSTETVEFYYSLSFNGSFSNNYDGYLRKIVSSKSGTCFLDYNADGTLFRSQDSDTHYQVRCVYDMQNGIKRICTVSEHVG
ncbi:MAG: DNRLRE domain-containing protein, partial [Candidatus Methanomethylophilaceae archaeon]|nr:DNRLRE domain-containing protein [Candidatus Methanomethylophilaceae archaeon]